MERIIPTHFIADCQQHGGHFGPHSCFFIDPSYFLGVKFVWRIKKAEKPLKDRLRDRGFTDFIGAGIQRYYKPAIEKDQPITKTYGDSVLNQINKYKA